MNNSVIYVGPFSFPNGGAAARRILGNAKALQSSGFRVVVACGQNDVAAAGSNTYDGIEVLSLSERNAEHLPRLLKHLSYLSIGKKTIAWLDALAEKPCALILYSGYSPYLLRLIPWAKRNDVKLIFDAVEWYDPDTFLHRFSPYQLNIELAMRWLLPKVPNIIAISSYLQSYYEKRGCNCVFIPPTLDVRSVAFKPAGRDASGPLKLVYAGSPGKKDLLDNILEAVLRLRAVGHDLHLVVAGITAAYAQSYRSVRSRSTAAVAAGVDFKGMLSHSESLALVQSADYSLLLRNDARYSRAGFSTKFAESFAVGTPVIANITGDLGDYLADGVTGFVCKGATADDMEASLLKALLLPSDGHLAMQDRCRAMAIQHFDYRVHTSSFSDFLHTARV